MSLARFMPPTPSARPDKEITFSVTPLKYIQTTAAIKLMENPELIQQAKEEHKMRVGEGYVCPIPKGVQPRSIAPKK